MSFQFDTVEDTFKYLDSSLDSTDLYEFGVFNGNTLIRIINGFQDKGIELRWVWGFDSFEGLPTSESSPYYDNNPDWVNGAFNVQRDFNLTSVNEAMRFVRDRVAAGTNNFYKFCFIPGYFSETLKDDNALVLKSAGYIHVDCDIYISSIECLDFMFRNKLVGERCLIRFDDYISTDNAHGQKLAWFKTKNKYDVKFEQLSINVVRILSYK